MYSIVLIYSLLQYVLYCINLLAVRCCYGAVAVYCCCGAVALLYAVAVAVAVSIKWSGIEASHCVAGAVLLWRGAGTQLKTLLQ